MGAVSASQTAAKLNWVSARLFEEQQWLSALQMLRENSHTLQEYSAHSMQRKRRWRSSSSILFSPFILNVLGAIFPQIIEKNHSKLWEALKRTASQTPALGEFLDAHSLSCALEKCMDASHLAMRSFCGCTSSSGLQHLHGWRALQRCAHCGRMRIRQEERSLRTDWTNQIAAAQVVVENITKEKSKMCDLYSQINSQIREMDECLKKYTTLSWLEALYLASSEKNIRRMCGNLLRNSEQITALYKTIPTFTPIEKYRTEMWRQALDASFQTILKLSRAAAADGHSLQDTESQYMKLARHRHAALHNQRAEIQRKTHLLDEEKISVLKKIQTLGTQSTLDVDRYQKQRIERSRAKYCSVSTTKHITRRYHQTYDYGIIKLSRKWHTSFESNQNSNTHSRDGFLLEQVVEWIESRVEKESKYRKALPYQTIYPPVVFQSMGLPYPSVYPFNGVFDEKSRMNNLKALNHFCIFDRSNIYLTKVFPVTKHFSAFNKFLCNTNQWEAALGQAKKCFKRHSSPLQTINAIENTLDIEKSPAELLAPLLHECPRYSLRMTSSRHKGDSTAVFKQIESLGRCTHALTLHHLLNAMSLLRSADVREIPDGSDALCKLFMPFVGPNSSELSVKRMSTLFNHITKGQFPRGLLAVEVLHFLKSSWERTLCFFHECFLGSENKNLHSERNKLGQLHLPLYINAVVCLKNTLRRHHRWEWMLKMYRDHLFPAHHVKKPKSKRRPHHTQRHAKKQIQIDPMVSHENILALEQKLVSLRRAKIIMTETHSKRVDFLVDPCNILEKRIYERRVAHLRQNLWSNGLACSSFILRYMKLQSPLIQSPQEAVMCE